MKSANFHGFAVIGEKTMDEINLILFLKKLINLNFNAQRINRSTWINHDRN